jgi:hypothetical protein
MVGISGGGKTRRGTQPMNWATEKLAAVPSR